MAGTTAKCVHELEKCLTEAPVLAFPDFGKEFILCTNASDIGIGAGLMQHSSSRKLQVIAYYSRKIAETEQKYNIIDRENLADVNALKHFVLLFTNKIHSVY